VTAEKGEHASSSQPGHRASESNQGEKRRCCHTEIVTYEAVTPALVPLEPMVVIDASGSKVDPQGSARVLHNRRKEEETGSQPAVLTVEELAALLRVNRKTLYEALSRGEIPGARRLGATYRILRGAVLEWLASGQDRVARSRRNR
jgi:excisionase family DNA binding protein